MNIYPWQDKIWAKLLSLRERLPHALLFHGPQGIGKFDLAKSYAQLLLCKTPIDSSPCGKCISCRWFEQGAHPNFLLMDPDAEATEIEGTETPSPEKGKKSQQIKVESIRLLGDFVNLSAHGGGWKIILIHPAESMNHAAANAVLKTLEEPPANILLLLVSNQIQRLIPTIRSRCMKIPVPLPDRQDSLAWLGSQGIQQAENMLTLASNAPLEAKSLAEDGVVKAAWEAFIGAISSNLPPTAAAEAMLAAETPDLIRWLQMWCHDIQAEKQGLTIRYYPDKQILLKRLGQSAVMSNLLAFHRTLNEAQRFSRHPLNKQLLLEKLMIAYNSAILAQR